MIKLTRLNHQVCAINPDHIVSAEAMPDTTLFLFGGDKLIVRESLDELIARVLEFRRAIRTPFEAATGTPEGDPPRDLEGRRGANGAASNERPRRSSAAPPHGDG